MLGLGQRGGLTSQNTLTGSASALKPYSIDQRSQQLRTRAIPESIPSERHGSSSLRNYTRACGGTLP